ncbi:MAG: LamG domain-containing protein, partial [Clostridiales bacterium]|nr:LamG domain-containing protein [Clostridiales bacterium]
NSKTAYETIFEGSKSTGTQIDDMYEMNQWYHVTLIVKPNAVYGYVDGVLKQVYTG